MLWWAMLYQSWSNQLNGTTMRDRSDNPLHHEQMFLCDNKASSRICYDELCYTNHGATSSMVPPWGIDLTTHCTMSRCSCVITKPHLGYVMMSYVIPIMEHQLNGTTMRDWSDNPLHHEQMLLCDNKTSLGCVMMSYVIPIMEQPRGIDLTTCHTTSRCFIKGLHLGPAVCNKYIKNIVLRDWKISPWLNPFVVTVLCDNKTCLGCVIPVVEHQLKFYH